MKSFLSAVWSRVVSSYKSTLVGLGCGVLLIVVEQFAVSAESSASPVLRALAAVAVIVGAALKSKAL